MKVGIVSDTHITKHSEKIDKLLVRYFKEVDVVIHVGDFNSAEVINRIKKYKKFYGVYGNNDKKDVRKILKEKEILNIGGYKIGIIHGHGQGKNVMEKSYEEFKNDKVDIIIFGHTHKPIIKTKGKVLMINPGSPTRKLKERWHSYIILELEKKKISAKISLF